MISSRELLAAARAAQGIPSNYRLARALDVPEKSIYRWSAGKNTPDDPMAVRLAEMAGLDPAYVLASMYAQRAAEGPLQTVWATIARRTQAAAAAVLVVIVSVLGVSLPAGDAHAQPVDGGVVCILCQLASRLLRAFLGLLQARPVRLHPQT